MTVHVYLHTTDCRCGHSFIHSEAFTVEENGASRKLTPLRAIPPAGADVTIIRLAKRPAFICAVCAVGREESDWEERQRWADTLRRKQAESLASPKAKQPTSPSPKRETSIEDLI